MATEAQKRAIAKYDAANTTKVLLKLNNKTDADILERLNEVNSKQGYIKDLIRRDMFNRCKNCLWYSDKEASFKHNYCDHYMISSPTNGLFTENGYCSYFEEKTEKGG